MISSSVKALRERFNRFFFGTFAGVFSPAFVVVLAVLWNICRKIPGVCCCFCVFVEHSPEFFLRQMFKITSKQTTETRAQLAYCTRASFRTSSDTRAESNLHQCPKTGKMRHARSATSCFRALNRSAQAGRRARFCGLNGW